MAKPRVFLADDHVLLLSAFTKLLADECEIVGHAADGRTLVASAPALEPDVILLEVTLPLLNGLDAGYQIKRIMPDVRLVFVTMHEGEELAAEAFRIGASAYLLKRSADMELKAAIREVMLGRSYVTPLLVGRLIGSLVHAEGGAALRELTHREREVLQLLAEGYTTKEVGGLLKLTPRTVAVHEHRIKEQLNVRSTAALIQYAIKHHMV